MKGTELKAKPYSILIFLLFLTFFIKIRTWSCSSF